MVTPAVPSPAVRSGRTGRRPGGSGTRAEILSAARKLFAERGYAGATIRAIAQEAGVDGALVHHFFASKEGVFAAAIEDTFAPADILPPVLEAGLDGMGERLVRTFLNKWEEPKTDRQLLAVLRSAVSNEEAARLLRSFLTQELLGRITEALDDEDSELRATLIGAQLVGVAFLRYVLHYGPIAHMDSELLVELISPTIQHYLTEPLQPAAPARRKAGPVRATRLKSAGTKPVSTLAAAKATPAKDAEPAKAPPAKAVRRTPQR
jgi:AcrR family transcriptional regulator